MRTLPPLGSVRWVTPEYRLTQPANLAEMRTIGGTDDANRSRAELGSVAFLKLLPGRRDHVTVPASWFLAWDLRDESPSLKRFEIFAGCARNLIRIGKARGLAVEPREQHDVEVLSLVPIP